MAGREGGRQGIEGERRGRGRERRRDGESVHGKTTILTPFQRTATRHIFKKSCSHVVLAEVRFISFRISLI